jgi:hypothetical protein
MARKGLEYIQILFLQRTDHLIKKNYTSPRYLLLFHFISFFFLELDLKFIHLCYRFFSFQLPDLYRDFFFFFQELQLDHITNNPKIKNYALQMSLARASFSINDLSRMVKLYR